LQAGCSGMKVKSSLIGSLNGRNFAVQTSFLDLFFLLFFIVLFLLTKLMEHSSFRRMEGWKNPSGYSIEILWASPCSRVEKESPSPKELYKVLFLTSPSVRPSRSYLQITQTKRLYKLLLLFHILTLIFSKEVSFVTSYRRRRAKVQRKIEYNINLLHNSCNSSNLG
jgi:hypothetical protein